MVDETIKPRVDALAEMLLRVETEKEDLAEAIGNEIASRILSLFSQRSREERNGWPTFDQWLVGQFNHDTFSVFDIFDHDPVLKELVAYVNRLGIERWTVAKVANKRFFQAGTTVGLGRQLSSATRL